MALACRRSHVYAHVDARHMNPESACQTFFDRIDGRTTACAKGWAGAHMTHVEVAVAHAGMHQGVVFDPREGGRMSGEVRYDACPVSQHAPLHASFNGDSNGTGLHAVYT